MTEKKKLQIRRLSLPLCVRSVLKQSLLKPSFLCQAPGRPPGAVGALRWLRWSRGPRPEFFFQHRRRERLHAESARDPKARSSSASAVLSRNFEATERRPKATKMPGDVVLLERSPSWEPQKKERTPLLLLCAGLGCRPRAPLLRAAGPGIFWGSFGFVVAWCVRSLKSGVVTGSSRDMVRYLETPSTCREGCVSFR